MKISKVLLLSSSAAVIGVAGIQTPAAAVEYVKVCSLYGAGFYYIPGTDTCLKIGGYVRFQETYNPGNSITNGQLFGTGGRSTRSDSQDWAQRTRAIATFDTRQQTAYGTLRTYLLLGFNQDSTSAASTAPSVYMTRGFIQMAGFTFGKATSFFDFYQSAAVSYNPGMLASPDTGDLGWMTAGYTGQFGNGVSATFAAEQSRRSGTANLSTSTTLFSLDPLTNPTGSNYGGLNAPNVGMQDIIGSLRIDQSWGSAQISAALHDASASYNSTGATTTENTGHPDSKWGWALSGGLRLHAPMVGPGDYFQTQFTYSEGAVRYTSMRDPGSSALNLWQGNKVAYGFQTDGVFTNGNGIALTTAWGFAGSYEHYWTPALRTSIYGSYQSVSYNSDATRWICNTQTGANSAFQSTSSCNPDYNWWSIGSRSQWNVTKDLYVGFDVIYQRLNSSSPNASNTLTMTTNSGAKPANTYTVSDLDTWSGTWRIHRDIVP